MMEIIKKVVSAYKDIGNPFVLVRKTNQEEPWKCTKIYDEINCDAICSYYKKHEEKILGW